MASPPPLDSEQPPVWWKEPMVWLIAGLPAAAVVAGLVTVMIAAHKPDSLVNEEYVKQGMAVVSPGSQLEAEAVRLGIAADMVRQAGRISVRLAGRLEKFPDALSMTLVHPAHSDQDFSLQLVRTEHGTYFGDLPETLGGKRRVLIEPPDHAWRLAGDIQLSPAGSWRLAAGSPLSTTHPQGNH